MIWVDPSTNQKFQSFIFERKTNKIIYVFYQLKIIYFIYYKYTNWIISFRIWKEKQKFIS